MPFGDNVQYRDDIKYCVLSEPLVFQPTDDISPVTRALLEGLLSKRPRNRLTIGEIKSHPYFRDVYVVGMNMQTSLVDFFPTLFRFAGTGTNWLDEKSRPHISHTSSPPRSTRRP